MLLQYGKFTQHSFVCSYLCVVQYSCKKICNLKLLRWKSWAFPIDVYQAIKKKNAIFIIWYAQNAAHQRLSTEDNVDFSSKI